MKLIIIILRNMNTHHSILHNMKHYLWTIYETPLSYYITQYEKGICGHVHGHVFAMEPSTAIMET